MGEIGDWELLDAEISAATCSAAQVTGSAVTLDPGGKSGASCEGERRAPGQPLPHASPSGSMPPTRDPQQADFPFELNDTVYDDVFEEVGTVIQLPSRSLDPQSSAPHAGQVCVDFPVMGKVWRTWGHLAIRERAAKRPCKDQPGERRSVTVVDLDLTNTGTEASPRAPRQSVVAPPQTSRAAAGTIHAFFSGGRPPVPAPCRELRVSSGTHSLASGTTSSGAQRMPQLLSPEAATSPADTLAAAPAATSDADQPQLAPIERDRKLPQLPDAKKRGASKPGSDKDYEDDLKVSIAQRLKEFQGESLVDRVGALFCDACNTRLSLKKSSIGQHLKTAVHKTNLAKLHRRKSDAHDIKAQLKAYFTKHDREAGKSVDLEVMAHRFRVVRQHMWAGVEIEKINKLRPVLEGAGRLTDSAHLRSLIPRILDQEKAILLEEVANEVVSAIFDGTRREGEAINLVLRFCTADFHIKQRLVAFVTALKHLNGKEAAALVAKLLMKDMNLDSSCVAAFIRDSAAANGVCVRGMQAVFIHSSDILCCCHTLNHVGEHFELTTLAEFMTPWITLVSNNVDATSIWRDMIGEAVCGYSKVHWYCRAEIEMQIARNFASLCDYLDKLRSLSIGEATTQKMLDIYRSRTDQLQLELAAMLV